LKIQTPWATKGHERADLNQGIIRDTKTILSTGLTHWGRKGDIQRGGKRNFARAVVWGDRSNYYAGKPAGTKIVNRKRRLGE